MGRLDNKVILVVGAGEHLGRSAPLLFAQEGACVVIAARRRAVLDETADLIRAQAGRVTTVAGSAANRDDVDRMIAAAVEGYGRLDVLYNNIGGGWVELDKKIHELSDAAYNQIVLSHPTSVFNACRAAIAQMLRQGEGGSVINATVCFTVPQALAVGEAMERGLRRREAEGLDVARMAPVCTLMVGRLDDWMQVVAQRDGIVTNPGYLHWAGIACFKKANALYRERGYRPRLLAAAYRHHLHWSELIGGDLILTTPWEWQRRFNASGIPVRERFFQPVEDAIVDELCRKFPDFRRAFEADGLTPPEFDTYGATVRTLRAFIDSYHQLQALIRDFMLPNPDVRAN